MKAAALLSTFLMAVCQALTCSAAAQTPEGRISEIESDRLDELRQEALSLVNEARREKGLQSLESAESLQAAAQAHAEDMLTRDYYAHVSPEGEDVQHRYTEHGGSRWRLAAENIARCRGCSSPATAARVQMFHEGWMESDEHRDNILARGLDSFGFGIAGADGRIYAVQNFAGPGTSRGLAGAGEPVPLDPAERVEQALEAINRARNQEGLTPLRSSEALTTVADRALAGASGDALIDRSANPLELLPGEAADWRSLKVQAAACGGCGTRPNTADIRHFTGQWLDDSQHRRSLLSPEATHLGFAMSANGEGRKRAAAVIGVRR